MSRTILGKRPALAAEGEKQVFSSPNSVLISPCEHPNDIWTQPKVSSEEKASRLPPIRSLFFHHYDWNRWFASLATTVDNTIKMADRSFKHGRQWCIRRIVNSTARPLVTGHMWRTSKHPKVLKKWGKVIMVGSRRVFVLFLIVGRRADHPMEEGRPFPYLFLP